MKFDSVRLKQLNIDLIRKALKENEYCTKNSIARKTGLSAATCRNILNELLAGGEIIEVERAASTGGRPSRRFTYNKNHSFIGLIYSRKEGDESFLFCRVIDMLGNQVFEKYYDFIEVSPESFDTVFDEITLLYPDMRAAAIGIPGVVQGGEVRICDFKALSHTPLGPRLAEKWGLEISLENDVNATALGYYYDSPEDHPECLAYIYYPRDGNAGAGIIVNGKVIRGCTDFAGELSYLPLGFGMERQGRIQKDLEKFTILITKTVMSINCILNPSVTVVSGTHFTAPLIEAVTDSLRRNHPREHLPEIIFENDIHDSFINGLKFLGFQKFSSGIELVKTYEE